MTIPNVLGWIKLIGFGYSFSILAIIIIQVRANTTIIVFDPEIAAAIFVFLFTIYGIVKYQSSNDQQAGSQ